MSSYQTLNMELRRCMGDIRKHTRGVSPVKIEAALAAIEEQVALMKTAVPEYLAAYEATRQPQEPEPEAPAQTELLQDEGNGEG